MKPVNNVKPSQLTQKKTSLVVGLQTIANTAHPLLKRPLRICSPPSALCSLFNFNFIHGLLLVHDM